MKNDFFKTSLRSFSGRVAVLIATGVLSPSFVSTANASPELDRQYSLSSIGVLRAWDNVDGLFGDLITKSFTEHLAPQSRFVVQDLSKANAAMQNSKLPYSKVIEDPAILTQLAKTFRLDSFLRTKAYKEGPHYKFTIDWVHAQKLQILASETVEIEEPFRGEGKLGSAEFRSALTDALDRMIAKVPFKGAVTGRDQTAVTVNLGESSGISKGDTLIFATLDDVKYHPLLKTVVDWRLTPTGRAIVDEVDDGIAFAKIDTEEYGRQIQRFQKVVQIIPAPENVKIDSKSLDLEEMEKKAQEPPRIGYLSPGLLLGSTTRDASTDTGSGFLYGAKGEIQAWMTSDFFADLRLAYGAASYTQKNATTGATRVEGIDLSLSQFRIAGGYFYHVTPNFFGPKGWIKFGYQSTSYSLPRNTTAQTGNVSYSGLFLGVGGDLPVRKDYGLILDVDFGLFGSGTEESSFFGTSTGGSSVNFFAGGYAWINSKLKAQVGLDFKSNSIDFVTGGSISNKTLAISPSLLFYF
jgi:hypothetical protein